MKVALRELEDALSQLRPGGPPAMTWLLPELRTLLGAQFAGAYRPVATNAGWSLAFMHGAGPKASGYVGTFQSYVAALPPSESFLALGNPHLIRPHERNKVLTLGDIIHARSLGEHAEPFDSLFRRLGIAGHDQLRVIACEGARQLAWVGATREEQFTPREAALLRRLTPSIRARLRLEHQLPGRELLVAALDAALDALPVAAFVLGPRGSVEMANRPGWTLLDREREAVLDEIRRCAQRHGARLRDDQTPREEGAFSITRLVAPGWPAYLLAIGRRSDGISARVMQAQRAWGLSVRQARVLELLATGASNKEIATSLACAEATIETHVTELFRRSGARSRAGLVGLLLRMA